MKKIIFILSVLFICNSSFAKSKPDSLSESIFYSNIFTSFYYLDNSDLTNSLNYWQKAFDISKNIDNKKIKAYASAFRAVWFQTKFPEAKDIIGRQSNLADAISNYNSIVTKTELDKKILSLLNTLIDNRFYNFTY